MLVTGVSASPQVVEGTIQRIDLIGRTIAVLLPHGLRIFDVPAQCDIRLNGERVKFRLLQSGDRVQIPFFRKRGILAALTLEVTTRRPAMEDAGS
jgi:hypothetical protein